MTDWKIIATNGFLGVGPLLNQGTLSNSLNCPEFLAYHELSETSCVQDQVILSDFAKGKSRAWIPLSIHGEGVIISHAGTTWGGLICQTTDLAEIQDQYSDVFDFLESNLPVRELQIRLPPEAVMSSVALHTRALRDLGAKQVVNFLGRMITSTSDLLWNRLRKRSLHRASHKDTEIQMVPIDDPYLYEIISSNRHRRHQVRLTHSIDDLKLIRDFTKDSWQGFLLIHDDHPCAGAICVADSQFTSIQYLAGSDCAYQSGLQDLIVRQLITCYQPSRIRPLLLGTSTDPATGHGALNFGLDRYKASWGASPYSYSTLAIYF